MHLKVFSVSTLYHKSVVTSLANKYLPPDMLKDMGLNSKQLHGQACETNHDFWKTEQHLH